MSYRPPSTGQRRSAANFTLSSALEPVVRGQQRVEMDVVQDYQQYT
jgi:hypothetical protein